MSSLWKRLLPLVLFATAAIALLVALRRAGVHDGVTPAPAIRIAPGTVEQVDRVGLTLTRVSVAEEVRIGNQLAPRYAHARDRAQQPTQAYLDRVTARLAALTVRKGIPYQVHYVASGIYQNAFALPGGHIVIDQGLLNLIDSEAGLAAVLGHEIQHIDQRHAIGRLQYELAARRLGLGDAGLLLVTLGPKLFQAGYAKQQELDADRLSVQMCAQLGYRPSAMADVFANMHGLRAQFEAPPVPGPAHEIAHLPEAALEEYFRTHPRYEERIAQIHRLAGSYAPRPWIDNRDEFQRYCPQRFP